MKELEVYIIDFPRQKLKKGYLVENPDSCIHLTNPYTDEKGNIRLRSKLIEYASLVDRKGIPLSEWDGILTLNAKDINEIEEA